MLVYIPICPVYHYCSYWTYMFDHLAANGAGLTGSQIAVVAVLQIHADLGGGFHLELIHGGAGLGDVELVAVLARHNHDLLFVFIFLLRSGLVGYRSHSLTRIRGSMRIFRR